MRIGGVNIPKELLDAQANGKLVMFAGAGVSMSPPSNYPNFARLADDIAAGTLSRGSSEPVERFLGRLIDCGVEVHRRAQGLLSKGESRPNALHEHLLTLAGSGDAIRLVTTNFDTHFSSAAESALPCPPETYYAPALPLGDDFRGIVYLHGCVAKDECKMVLTDRDFARAYLTEGWASRFLLPLFGKCTVLFVGYSHDDSVMSYLARGLPEGYSRQRYALTPEMENREEHWRFLGITPVYYPQERDGDHSALQHTVAEWARYVTTGALEHGRRIRGILRGTPPLLPEEDDYLAESLSHPPRVRFFVQYALDRAWLAWAEQKGALAPLFDPCAQLDECQSHLIRWISARFACGSPDDCLALVLRAKQRMNPALWITVARQLAFGKPEPSPEVLAMWTPLLLQASPGTGWCASLCGLLEKCGAPQCRSALLLLLDHVTRPALKLKHAIPLPNLKRQVDWELAVPLTESDLQHIWESTLEPRLPEIAEEVASVAVHQLAQAHRMLMSVGRAYRDYDPTSWSRSAIEPHPQDSYSGEIGTLVNLARDSLKWMAKNQPERMQRLVDELAHSEAPLVRRLAVYCVTEFPGIMPDHRLDWVLSNHLLYSHSVRHEVFRLLEANYPCSSEQMRVRLLNAAAAGPPDVEEDEDGHRAYAVYNLVGWLHRSAPDCEHTRALFERLQQEHPDFRAREYPDLGHYFILGDHTGESRHGAIEERVRQLDPISDIDKYLSANEAETEDDRRIFLRCVGKRAELDWVYGLGLLESLAASFAWDTELWEPTLDGLAKATKTARQLSALLSFLERHGSSLHNVAPALRFLKDTLADTERLVTLSAATLRRAEKAFSLLWPKSVDAPPLSLPEGGSWLFVIQDHVGGIAADFWVYALSRYLQRKGTSSEIPRSYKRAFESILSGDSEAAHAGRARLAHYIHFLYTLDDVWTQRNVLPLLDWSADETTAEQAWHCYLNNNQVNLDAFRASMGYYRQTFTRVTSRLGMLRRSFVQSIALFAVESSTNPLADNWLAEFVKAVDPSDRADWARAVQHDLEGLNDSAIRDVWDRWLREYWQQRLSGVPVKPGQDELREMVAWLCQLRPVFPAAVKVACSDPAPEQAPWYRLAKQDWLAEHPGPLADLLLFLLASALANAKEEPFHDCRYAAKLIRIVESTGVDEDRLRQLWNGLCALGCCSEDDIQRLL